MLRTIKLHGELGEQFSPSYNLAVETPAEAVRALCVQLPGFERALRDGEWVCIRGPDGAGGVYCDVEMLHICFGQLQEFHIIPAAIGAKSGGGIGKIILGIILVGAAIFVPGLQFTIGFLGVQLGATSIAMIGGLMLLGGISQLISPHPKVEQTDNKPGYLFNGAVNSFEEGSICPIVFGRIRAGTVVVSAGIVAERIGGYTPTASSGSIPSSVDWYPATFP